MKRHGWFPEASPEQAQACLAPFPAELLRAYPVSAQVNSPAWNRPEALAPVVQDATGGHPPCHNLELFATESERGEAPPSQEQGRRETASRLRVSEDSGP